MKLCPENSSRFSSVLTLQRPIVKICSELVEISSKLVEISSEFVEISSELVEISSELVSFFSDLVSTNSELLIISVFRKTLKAVSRTVISRRNQKSAALYGLLLLSFLLNSPCTILCPDYWWLRCCCGESKVKNATSANEGNLQFMLSFFCAVSFYSYICSWITLRGVRLFGCAEIIPSEPAPDHAGEGKPFILWAITLCLILTQWLWVHDIQFLLLKLTLNFMDTFSFVFFRMESAHFHYIPFPDMFPPLIPTLQDTPAF